MLRLSIKYVSDTCRSLEGTQIELFEAKNPKYKFVNTYITFNYRRAF